jgi:hypothetical protein
MRTDVDCSSFQIQITAAVEEWKGRKERGEMAIEEEEEEDLYLKAPAMSDADRVELAMQEGRERRVKAMVAIPTQKDIEDALLRRKKIELMQMYALDEFDDNGMKIGTETAPEAAVPAVAKVETNGAAAVPVAAEATEVAEVAEAKMEVDS